MMGMGARSERAGAVVLLLIVFVFGTVECPVGRFLKSLLLRAPQL